MNVDLGDVDLETDSVIVNAMDRHSDTASPNSLAAAAWLQAVVAAVRRGRERGGQPAPDSSRICAVS